MALDPSNDAALLKILEQNNVPYQGGTIRIPARELPDECWEAIDLLSDEWDYDWTKDQTNEPE